LNEQAEMDDKTETTTAQNRRRIPVTELLLTAATVVCAVVAVAMSDPKIPEFVGD